MFTSEDQIALRKLTNEILHNTNVEIASHGRKNTERLLRHLKETERRRLYMAFEGVTSLHVYCTKMLKFSEGSAGRRVSAARMLADLPELAEKIVDGSVNLSTLGILNTYVRAEEKRTKEKMPQAQKQDLVRQIENKSKEQAERVVIAALPEAQPARNDRRPIAEGKTRISLDLTPELKAKFDRLRAQVSHSRFSDLEVFELAIDDSLAKRDPLSKKIRQSKARSVSAAECGNTTTSKTTVRTEAPDVEVQDFEVGSIDIADREFHPNAPRTARKPNRVHEERALMQKSGGQCEWIYETGARCTSRHQIQTDHIIPIAKGGGDELANKQKLCRAHNAYKSDRTVRERQAKYAA